MLKDGRLAGRCRLAGRLKCVSHSHSANPHLTTQLIIKPWVLQEPGRMLALAGSSGSSRLAVAAHRGHAASSSRAALQLGSHCRASGVCSTPRRSRQAVAPRAAGQEDTSTSAAPSVPSAGPAKTGRSRGPAAVNDSVPEQLFYEVIEAGTRWCHACTGVALGWAVPPITSLQHSPCPAGAPATQSLRNTLSTLFSHACAPPPRILSLRCRVRAGRRV